MALKKLSVDNPAPPTILLAPMEGLLDFVLRDILTRVGGVDRCVSEFIRVSDTLLPERVFTRVVPELLNGGRTFAGVPVRPQLLGSDPVCLAENAARVASISPFGVDLNFGCPAKVVNRHGGGAALLQEPELLATIVSAVRRAVPAHIPVSAKMRLGFNDASLALECAHAIASSGADELVVHARTKADGYRPPAYWDRVSDIRQAVAIPVVANGEIWDWQSAQDCMAVTGCDSVMIGRGALNVPNLSRVIKYNEPRMPWPQVVQLLQKYTRLEKQGDTGLYHVARIKQWLGYLRKEYTEALTLFNEIRALQTSAEIAAAIGRY